MNTQKAGSGKVSRGKRDQFMRLSESNIVGRRKWDLFGFRQHNLREF